MRFVQSMCVGTETAACVYYRSSRNRVVKLGEEVETEDKRRKEKKQRKEERKKEKEDKQERDLVECEL